MLLYCFDLLINIQLRIACIAVGAEYDAAIVFNQQFYGRQSVFDEEVGIGAKTKKDWRLKIED